MRFLLLGLGSIGKRHYRILQELGHDVTTVDPNPQVGADYQSVPMGPMDAVLDCTQPDVRPWWLYTNRSSVFVEKPLGSMADSTRISALHPPRSWRVQMGFCYHWASSLQRFVNIIKESDIYSLSLIGGQHLQGWHKEDYRDVAQRYKGVVTDSMPHSLYIARWILGDLELAGSVSGKVSNLDIEVEDTAAVLLRTPKGQPCFLLADYLRDPREFWIEAVTSDGVHSWDFEPGRDVDEMYAEQMKAFCRLAAGEMVKDYPNLEDGIAVQRLLDKIVKGKK